MIAADTSSLILFLEGSEDASAEKIASAAKDGTLVLPPVVIAELLGAEAALQDFLARIEILDLQDGYWLRVGASRRLLREKGLKARLGDALIAQSCIDHDVAIITGDKDFRHYEKHCGLKIA